MSTPKDVRTWQNMGTILTTETWLECKVAEMGASTSQLFFPDDNTVSVFIFVSVRSFKMCVVIVLFRPRMAIEMVAVAIQYSENKMITVIRGMKSDICHFSVTGDGLRAIKVLTGYLT